jgi:hypothetical protein
MLWQDVPERFEMAIEESSKGFEQELLASKFGGIQ